MNAPRIIRLQALLPWLFIACGLGLCCQQLTAQSLRLQVAQRQRKSTSLHVDALSASSRPVVITEVQPKKPVQRPTHILCTLLKKQHGWYDAVDRIDSLEAPHYDFYYRLSEPNASGHWTRIECFTGSGRYRTGKMESYLMRVYALKTDTTLNAEWARRANNICRRQMIADPTGNEVMQERVFDPKDSLIYVYSRTRISANQYIGAYRDALGLPAEMHKEASFMLTDSSAQRTPFTYGTIVMLTEDHWGNDSIVQLLDAKGRPKLDSDSAFMQIYTFDSLGRRTRQQAADENGHLINDNWGTCGTQYTYDNRHKRVQTINMDSTWSPVRMPYGRRVQGSSVGTICKKYVYDDYGREVEKSFWTYPEMLPDTNSYGAHVQYTIYDEQGRLVESYGRNREGRMHPSEDSYFHIRHINYDARGRKTETLWLDSLRQPVPAPNIYRETWEYDSKGTLVHHATYRRLPDGSDEPVSEDIITPQQRYTRYANGSTTFDTLDSEGRLLQRAHFDRSGRPVLRTTDLGTFAWRDYSYTPGTIGGQRSMLKIYSQFGADGQPIGTREEPSVSATQQVWQDNEGHFTKLRLQAIPAGGLYRRDISSYEDLLNPHMTSATSLDDFGNACRTGGALFYELRFYKANVIYTPRMEEATWVAIDEFGDRDYIATLNDGADCYQRLTRHSYVYFDDHDREIKNMPAFRDSCYKALSIEVVDSSIAHPLGLRSGDIIQVWGDFAVDGSQKEEALRSQWSLASVNEASRPKQVRVLRVGHAGEYYVHHELTLPAGTPRELGILVHRLYRTDTQQRREQQLALSPAEYEQALAGSYDPQQHTAACLAAYRNLLSSKQQTSTLPATREEASTCILPTLFLDLFRSNRGYGYGHDVIDPSVIIAAAGDSTSWHVGEPVETLLQLKEEQNVTYWLTTDGTTLRSYSPTSPSAPTAVAPLAGRPEKLSLSCRATEATAAPYLQLYNKQLRKHLKQLAKARKRQQKQ